MIGNLLTRFGIGGATVDAVLQDSEIEVGGTLRAEIRITGGSARQEIRGVALDLVTRCLVEGPGGGKTHGDIVLVSGHVEIGTVEPGEHLSFPIEMQVPVSAPISIGSTHSVLRTRLDVAGAVDARDSDPVTLLPNRSMTAVLEGIQIAGFRLVETEVEYHPRREPAFVQEFDFRPAGFGDFGIEEVEISFAPRPRGIEVLLTVDNRGGFFIGGRERSVRLRVDHAEAEQLDMAGELRRAIDRLR